MAKTDAQLEAQARASAAALAASRKVKVDAALEAMAPAADMARELIVHRDGLHQGETRNAISSVISILTSASVMAISEQSSLQATINAGDVE